MFSLLATRRKNNILDYTIHISRAARPYHHPGDKGAAKWRIWVGATGASAPPPI